MRQTGAVKARASDRLRERTSAIAPSRTVAVHKVAEDLKAVESKGRRRRRQRSMGSLVVVVARHAANLGARGRFPARTSAVVVVAAITAAPPIRVSAGTSTCSVCLCLSVSV